MVHIAEHGLVAAGRFLSLRVEISDRAGSLAQFLATIGGLGASVVDLEQSRLGGGLAFGNVEVSIRLECRGPAHRDELVSALTAAGYRVLDHH